jgi:hypothetical protein
MISDQNQQKNTPPWPVINDYNMDGNMGPGDTIKVRCIAPQGMYYRFARRREGDVFTLVPVYETVIDPKTGKHIKENGDFKRHLITAEAQFSDVTMELVEDETPDSVSTAQGAINLAQDELNEAKIPAKKR